MLICLIQILLDKYQSHVFYQGENVFDPGLLRAESFMNIQVDGNFETKISLLASLVAEICLLR